MALNVMELFHSLSNLTLIGLAVYDEHEGVVILDLLHGGLSGQWIFDNSVFIELILAVKRLNAILWSTRKLQSIRSVEGSGRSRLDRAHVLALRVGLRGRLCFRFPHCGIDSNLL